MEREDRVACVAHVTAEERVGGPTEGDWGLWLVESCALAAVALVELRSDVAVGHNGPC